MCWSEKCDSNVFKEFTCRKCNGNIAEAVEQDETLCDKVETVTGN